MPKTIVLLSAALILASSLALRAEETTLDVEKAVRLAVANNLELKSQRISLATAARERKNAWNQFLPSLDAAATLSRLNEATSATGLEPSPWYLAFSVRASLRLSLATQESIRATVLSYESGLIDFETAQKKLERDVRKAFYAMLLSQESIRLAEQELATAERRYQQTLKNFQAGLAPRLDMLSARVAAENLKPALEEQRVAYAASLMSFQALLGLELEEQLALRGSIEARVYHFDSNALVAQYTGGRLDVQSLEKQLQILENRKRQQKLSSLSPALSLSASLAPTGNLADNSDWSDEGYLSLGVSIPLEGFVPGSATQVALADTQDSIEKVRLAVAQARRQAAIEIKAAVLGLEKSLRTMEALQLNVSLAQEVYTLSEVAYAAGTQELLEVQNASDELQKAKLLLLKERYNYLSGLIDLSYALNATLNDLEEKHVQE
jgi:outer membrane protein TolC